MLVSLPKVIISTTLGLWLVFTLWAICTIMDDNTHIYAENGLLENIQACILLIAFSFYLVNAAIEKQLSTLILLTCSLLCYTFFLRELDVENFDIPQILHTIGSGFGRNISIVAAFLAVSFYAAKNYQFYKQAAISFLKTRPGILLMVGGAFLIIGSSFESFDSIAHNSFIEEEFELLAYILILLSSITSNSYLNNREISFSVAGIKPFPR